MSRLIDLTVPIGDHFRWPVEREVRGNPAQGDVFRITSFRMSVHAFTHVDAPCHVLPDAAAIEATPLDTVVGEAAVIDLTAIGDGEGIGAADLDRAGSHVDAGGIAILKTAWDRRRSILTPEFWKDAPYVTRDGAEWLLDRGIRCAAFDFPQDYVIRLLLHGERRPLAENVTHDVLLAGGVTLVEYLCNTAELTGDTTWFSAAPIKLSGADGAPARAYAVERDE